MASAGAVVVEREHVYVAFRVARAPSKCALYCPQTASIWGEAGEHATQTYPEASSAVQAKEVRECRDLSAVTAFSL
jgi:hypothetical protein